MRVLFNLCCTQPSGNTKRHGGGIYGEIVFKRIVERKLDVIAYYDSKRWLNPDIHNLIKTCNIQLLDINMQSLSDMVVQNNISIIYTPILREEFAKFDICRVIGTIHGLRALETPNDYISTKYSPFVRHTIKYYLRKILNPISRRRRFEWLNEISNNRMIDFVMVSHHTEYSYKVYYPQHSHKKISVYYSPSTIKNIFFDEYVGYPFFLMVSGNRWDKNVLRAIIAIDEMISMKIWPSNFKVKITGAKSDKIYKYKIKNKEYFEFLGYVSDMELCKLYHDAYCLIYPSLNEGFGYPPLEAMHYKTPVITSAISSIPEICGNGVLYFSPFDINEIKARILQILNPVIYNDIANMGHQRCNYIKNIQEKDLDGLIDYIYNK